MDNKRVMDWLYLILGLTLMVGAYGWHQVVSATSVQGQDTVLNAEAAQEKEAAIKPGTEDGKVPPQNAPMSVWMEKKLQYSQETLRLLAVGDLNELQMTARRMQLVSKVEGFVRSNNATYKNQLRVFQLANEELIRQAERGSIEGATLAFHQLTSSCVNCHIAIRQPAASGQ